MLGVAQADGIPPGGRTQRLVRKYLAHGFNVRRLRRRLMMAGFYDENAITVFRVIRLGCVVIFPLLTFFVWHVGGGR